MAVTHLDHIAEEQRDVQIKHIVSLLEVDNTILVGDLNALTRTDYDSEEWSMLEAKNQKNGWSPPAHGCLERLRTAGFNDVFASVHGNGERGLAASEGSQKLTAHVQRPLYRIDYCFAGTGLGAVQDARVETAVRLSDHYPVSFDFEFPADAPTSKI